LKILDALKLQFGVLRIKRENSTSFNNELYLDRGIMKTLFSIMLMLMSFVLTAPAEAKVSPRPFTLKTTLIDEYTNIMPLGDSNTWGYNPHTNSTGQYVDATDGYRGPLVQGLNAGGMQKPNMVGQCPISPWLPYKCHKTAFQVMGDNNHEGHSGWRIDELSTVVANRVILYKPKYVLIHAGTNDLAQNYDIPNVQNRIQLLVTRIHLASPDTIVFLASLIKSPHAKWAELNSKILAVANANPSYVKYVPMNIIGDEVKDLNADKIHASSCGHLRMAYVWQYYMHYYYPTLVNVPASNPFYATTGVCATANGQYGKLAKR